MIFRKILFYLWLFFVLSCFYGLCGNGFIDLPSITVAMTSSLILTLWIIYCLEFVKVFKL